MSRRCDPPWQLDLRWELDRIRAVIDQAIHELGGLDWLVVAGGVGAYQRAVAHYILREQPLQEFEWAAEEQWRTCFLGPVYAIECALPHLNRRTHSDCTKILCIGSVLPRNPPADLAIYAASKAALEVWIRAQARRWRRRGVCMNTLATGWIQTPLTKDITEKKVERIVEAIGAHRMGTTEEAAKAAYWMLAEAPSYLSGDTIPMSGAL